ncbi:MAG: hypothetical protein WD021_11120 [Rhodothermales bacterium]
MDENTEPTQIAVRIESCIPSEFHQHEIGSYSPDTTDLQYTTTYDLDFSRETHHLYVNLDVEVWLKSEEGRIDVAGISTRTTFKFRDLAPLLEENENEINVPDPVIASLLGVAVSTTRGILIGMSCDSLLSSNPLPMLSPMDMLRQMKAAAEEEANDAALE